MLQYEAPGKVRLLDKCSLNTAEKSHVHGMILSCIYKTLCEWVRRADVLVRERGFSRFFSETQALFKVVGVADLAAWREIETCFDEIAPAMVKKLVTGSGKATKAEVAAALEQFVGKQEYLCEDESDAVAVGIAWLILHGYVLGGMIMYPEMVNLYADESIASIYAAACLLARARVIGSGVTVWHGTQGALHGKL